MRTGRPQKYIVNIGDIFDDYECIGVTKNEKNYTTYVMKCTKCGKVKNMLASTVHARKGTSHKSCGKGLGITYDKEFYNRWQSMRFRTSDKYWDKKDYYDRGINSDAFASFIDFYNTMYQSWKEHVEKFGEDDTSLERIDVDKPYNPENCTWIRLREQKGNQQKTVYFSVTNIDTGEIAYHKNASQYANENNLPSYILEVINKNGTYKDKKYKRITKEEYNKYVS